MPEINPDKPFYYLKGIICHTFRLECAKINQEKTHSRQKKKICAWKRRPFPYMLHLLSPVFECPRDVKEMFKDPIPRLDPFRTSSTLETQKKSQSTVFLFKWTQSPSPIIHFFFLSGKVRVDKSWAQIGKRPASWNSFFHTWFSNLELRNNQSYGAELWWVEKSKIERKSEN